MGDGEVDGVDAGAVDDVGDADASFQFLSLHGITVFLLMFGLVGLALSIENGVREIWALVGAGVAGVASMWMIAQIYLFMKRLQSSGNVDLRNAVGEEGDVYLTIPAEGSGQVQVSVQGGLRMFDARSVSGEEIKTGERVRVSDVVGSHTLMVQRITETPSGEGGAPKETAS
jgi:membrane protein implicated in regulation of membrane protease activity